jgi:hypothetical protein
MLVADAYRIVLKRLLEVPGAETLINQETFLRLLTEVLFDFCATTGISKNAVNIQALANVSRYSVNPPASAGGSSGEFGSGAWGEAEWGVGSSSSGSTVLFKFMKAEHVFYGGRYLDKVQMSDLALMDRSWEAKVSEPKYWSEDAAPAEKFDVYPIPEVNGDAIGPVYGDILVTGRNFCVIGTHLPTAATLSMSDTLPFVPDSAAQYVIWGVVARLMNSSSENRDDQRALYADAKYREGVSLYRAIIDMEMEA